MSFSLDLGPALLLGVIQGLTEFLPISSTGHLILAGSLLDFTGDKIKVFEIAIQTGAILAVILVYWQRLQDTLFGIASEPRAQRFTANVAIGFLPAVVLGLALGSAIKAHLFTPIVVAAMFILGGIAILFVERWQETASPPRIAGMIFSRSMKPWTNWKATMPRRRNLSNSATSPVSRWSKRRARWEFRNETPIGSGTIPKPGCSARWNRSWLESESRPKAYHRYHPNQRGD